MVKKRKIAGIGVIIAVVIGFLVGAVILLGTRRMNRYRIVATNFVSYDFARAVLGDDAEIRMLLKPGAEMHDFEPTPQDIIDIERAELFIYIGGESESWVTDLLHNNGIDEGKTLRLMDLVEVKEEEVVEGMENEGGEREYDEHIWTNPRNAMKLVEGVQARLAMLRPGEAERYTENAGGYLARLERIDTEIRQVVATATKRELIFGDRFPFRYFVDEYGLKYYAAFPGCAEQTEASSQTVAFLVDKIKQDGVKVVLKIELTSGKLAQTIADETGAKVLELSAAHNISVDDFEQGVTYADLMERDIPVLKEALE